VINDFAAAGLGIAELAPEDLLTLQTGTCADGANRLVTGAGTGLGVALLDWDQAQYEVHSSEAGHADFAPVDELQDRLLLHLRRQFPRVSCERILSGGGFARIAAFLIESGMGEPSARLSEALDRGHAASAITELALSGNDPVAVQTLDVFASAYGSFAGNMALAMLAHGGVYVAGGIAPKIAAKLQDGTFMRAFTAKGRMQALLETMPVHVVMNVHVGLYGALAEAARHAR
jgi:glucokinase